MGDFLQVPCPWRILDDTGSFFLTGSIFGGIFNSIKGFRSAPVGFNRKLLGSFLAIKEKSPVFGAQAGVWGAMYTTFVCGFGNIQQKEGPWHSIISGSLTGAILSARQGVPVMLARAVMYSILIGLIEGFGIISKGYI